MSVEDALTSVTETPPRLDAVRGALHTGDEDVLVITQRIAAHGQEAAVIGHVVREKATSFTSAGEAARYSGAPPTVLVPVPIG